MIAQHTALIIIGLIILWRPTLGQVELINNLTIVQRAGPITYYRGTAFDMQTNATAVPLGGSWTRECTGYWLWDIRANASTPTYALRAQFWVEKWPNTANCLIATHDGSVEPIEAVANVYSQGEPPWKGLVETARYCVLSTRQKQQVFECIAVNPESRYKPTEIMLAPALTGDEVLAVNGSRLLYPAYGLTRPAFHWLVRDGWLCKMTLYLDWMMFPTNPWVTNTAQCTPCSFCRASLN